MAMRVATLLRDRGLRVPEDLSVVGYTASSDPVITSICIPAEQMAQAATDYLLGCLDGTGKKKRLDTTLSVDLVDRGTTRQL